MDKLKEIVDLLNLNKIKSIEIIDNKISKDTKIMQLYHGIRKGGITTDEEAKKMLYPNSTSSNAYYKLKHTFRERLFNTIFFIDAKSNKNSDYHNAYLNVQKITSLVGILIAKGLRRNAIYMAKKGLKIADQYQFTESQLKFARILRFNDATITGNNKNFLKYDSIVNDCTDLLRSEVKAEGLFYKVLILYVNNKSTKPFLYDEITSYLKELKEYEPVSQSANWIYYYTMIEIAKQLSINNYPEALATCDKALGIINTLDFKYNTAILNIASQAISCCIQLKLYEKGENNIMSGLQVIPEGIFNWFKYKELYIILCFHTKRYQKAWEIYNDTVIHKKFKKLPSSTLEIWKIYEAWLFFFTAVGEISITDDLRSKKFRFSKYANNVPTFFKDKQGLNVSILISQIALLLQQQKYDTVIDRMEAIAKYKDRYLKKEHNFRSNVFIRILLAIPKAQFNKKRVIEQSEKDRLMLSEVPIDIANQSADIEILPYEDIWKILLNQLK